MTIIYKRKKWIHDERAITMKKVKSKTQTDSLPYENLLTVVLSVGQTHTHDGINGPCFTRWIVHFIEYTIGTGVAY